MLIVYIVMSVHVFLFVFQTKVEETVAEVEEEDTVVSDGENKRALNRCAFTVHRLHFSAISHFFSHVQF